MSEMVKLDRSMVLIKPGEFVASNGEVYKISQVINLDEVIGIDVKAGRATRLLVSEIKRVEPQDPEAYSHIYTDLMDIGDKDWRIVEKRLEAIKPIMKGASRKEVEEHAKKLGHHYTTLYTWLRNYRDAGGVAGLLPRKEGRPEGMTLIDPMAEKIIHETIENFYLTKQRPKVEAVVRKVLAQCKSKNVKAPSKNTIRNRVAQLNEYDRLSKRISTSKARDSYGAASGHFEVKYPLHTVQIDHTKVDIMLVDDETRQSIGRPWITLAIDIYSRMVHGYYLSLEPPSVTSVAMCIANAVVPKDDVLLDHEIDAEWNIWGFMDTIHTDNGADFRSEALSRACRIYDINLEYRPVAMTNYGGHIERLIGTVMSEVHGLPGTTFSNIQEKQTYDSEGNACMTFSEYERWLLTFITKIYHKRKHTGIGTSPEAKFMEGVFGTLDHEGVGYPPKPSDPLSILIDFLPSFERTVQRNGINIEGLNYYDSAIRGYINAVDFSTNKKKKFIFKRDPRNISYIWFYDDETKVYYKISLGNQALPEMSLWEYRKIQNNLKEKNLANINDDDIISAYEELHAQVESAASKTKKARRDLQRKRIQDKTKVSDMEIAPSRERVIEPKHNNLLDKDDIPNFEVE